MKTKSSYHKENNVFKFQTFADRLTSINIDVVRRIGKRSETPEEADTFFSEGLQKWSELNCTEHFTNFKREITRQVQSLPQLVHHKDEIITALLTHLQVPKSMALQPVLDLVVQFARDLQVDFYPHFPEFFTVIVGLLGSYHHDVEALEAIFTCLSYLFKFLWRYMINDIEKVYMQYVPLLGAQERSYIRNFAAESFAFLMRKTKGFDGFLNFMLKRLADDPEETAGVGRLFFEMMKGVKKQLHSCTEQAFTTLLTKLGDEDERDVLPYEQVEEALVVTIQSLAAHTGKEHIGPIWKILLNTMTSKFAEFEKLSKKKGEGTADHVHRVLKLIAELASFKQGVLIGNSDQICKMSLLMSVLKGKALPSDHGNTLLEIVPGVLLSPYSTLGPAVVPKLVSQVFDSKYPRNLVMDFTRNIFSLGLFEKNVLPGLLSYCHSCMLLKEKTAKDDALYLVTDLVLNKCPLLTDASQLHNYNRYLLDFSLAMKGKDDKRSLPNYVITLLDTCTDEDCDKSKLWAALLCAPHIRPIKDEILNQKVKQVYDTIQAKFEKSKEDDDAFLICQALVALLNIDDSEEFFKFVSLDSVIDILRCSPSNVHTLRVADMFFTHAQNLNQPYTTEAILKNVFPLLENNLSSAFHQVRLLTLRILSNFDARLPILEDPALDQVGVFTICLEAEKIPLSVQDYRQKLVHLRKLECDPVQNNLPVDPMFAKVPLKYLIGNLYINFTLLWEPVGKLIESHARGLSKENFWSVYIKHLTTASDLAEIAAVSPRYDPRQARVQVEMDTTIDLPGGLPSLFMKWEKEVQNATDKPHHMNFRQLLWKTMQNFPDKCEPKSRELSPLLFRFLSNEYYPADASTAPTQDIRKTKEDTDETIMETEGDTAEEGEDAKEKEEKEENSPVKRSKRQAVRTFLVLLKLYSQFKGPKSLYMGPKLKDLYHEMLCHNDGDIQKVAFDCVMTYNNKSLIPYRENFQRLLDDKQFKNEIVLFSIDTEASIVDNDHRQEVLPVLMRILFGKMLGKAGKNTAGKSHAVTRKNIIFAFLAGCQQSELRLFFDLMFGPFKHFVEGDIVKNLTELTSDIDPSSVVPVGKLQGIIHTIDIIYKKLGNLIDLYLPDLLRMTLCLTALCHKLLEMREEIKGRVIGALKTLRTLCMDRVTQFFTAFENYPYTSQEIEAVFLAAVWPQLERLPDESISHPTPLLKLLLIWSDDPRLLPLLGKCHPEKPELTPLPYIVALLSAKNVSKAVISTVLEIVEHLVMTEGYEPVETEDAAPLEISNCLGAADDSPHLENSTIGIRLLFPHVPKVFDYLSGVVKTFVGQKGKKQKIPVKDLNILSNISQYVADPEQSATLVSLLLPYLVRDFSRTENVEVDILNTIANLIKKVESPGRFVGSIAKLCSILSARGSRTALCDVLQAIGNGDTSYQKLAEMVSNLNAWDKRRVEEPDYNVRLDTYVEIKAKVKTMETIDLDYLNMVMHNCAFFLRTTEDMSLRDSSSYTLQEIITRLSNMELEDKIFTATVIETLLPLIRAGLKCQSEVPRHEFIRVLAMAVKAFTKPTAMNLLKKLMDDDVEVDFFENICHIQMHRRSRALKRFTKHLDTDSIPSTVLLSYIMPMATVYITNTDYTKHYNLVDTAIEAVGAICKMLPWSKYLYTLKYYIYQLPKKLENQKTMTKLIVAILNGFHFDLSDTDGAGDVLNPPLKSVVKKSKSDDDGGKTVDGDDDEDELGENDDSPTEEATEGRAVDGLVKCSPELASRIHQVVIQSIIPELKKSLTAKAKSDDEHKKVKSKYAEDSEILRVPIALAMVKLLQKMPKGVLPVYLPGVLMKVCEFLRSRCKEIRDVSRDTLVKIMSSLGSQYFYYVLRELKSALRRGYQLHVLGFTVHALLKNMEPILQTGALDSSVHVLVEIFNEELFGNVGAEKEEEAIKGKIHEAKSVKSFDSYEMIAKIIGRSSVTKLILPLKEVLETNHSHKTTKKVESVLHRITQGLMENKELPVETLMVFIHGLVNEAMPMVTASERAIKDAPKPADPRLKPASTYIVPKEPPRGNKPASQTLKTNLHVLVEFGIQLLYYLLKRSSLVVSNLDHRQMLDPFITILAECLQSKHIKIVTLALRCLTWVLRFELPSLKENIEKVTSGLFVLLKNYAVAGGAKGENFDLVVICFKAVTVLVRDVKYHMINTEQLQVLLGYAEEDIHDYTRQATAFSLLQAILSRKLNVPEMLEVMTKVSNLSVTSESPHVRQQCRQVMLKFLINYPLGTKLKRYLEFYVMQLNYEMESGRDSVLEMLATVFTSFPLKIIHEHSGLFFVPLAVRLINDESPECRKKAALVIKTLLTKVDNGHRDELFTITITWCKDSKLLHRQLGLQIIGLFVEVESTKFEGRLQPVIPIILDQMDPSKLSQSLDDAETRKNDHVLFITLTSLLKILKECAIVRDTKWTEEVNSIWDHIIELLLYPYTWVRLASAQLLGLMFGAWKPEELVDSAQEQPKKKKKKVVKEYFKVESRNKLRRIAAQCMSQFQSQVDQELADQIIKNLVFLAKAIRHVTSQESEDDESDKPLHLQWLTKKMVREATFEATQNPKVYLKRNCVFKWIAAVAMDLGSDDLPEFLPIVLPPVFRVTSDSSSNMDETLKSLGSEVLELMKGIVGVEVFTRAYATVQQSVFTKREDRKKQKAMVAVSNPEVAARRRMKKQLAKRDAKKRKTAEYKAPKKAKKMKLQDIAILDD